MPGGIKPEADQVEQTWCKNFIIAGLQKPFFKISGKADMETQFFLQIL